MRFTQSYLILSIDVEATAQTLDRPPCWPWPLGHAKFNSEMSKSDSPSRASNNDQPATNIDTADDLRNHKRDVAVPASPPAVAMASQNVSTSPDVAISGDHDYDLETRGLFPVFPKGLNMLRDIRESIRGE